jgi:hypothetical protein
MFSLYTETCLCTPATYNQNSISIKCSISVYFYLLLLLLRFVLGPLACLPSELIWNHGSYRQLVGLFGRVISPVARPLPTQDNTNTGERRRDIHASSRIRTHDPSVRAGEDISCFRPRGHCDRLILLLIFKTTLLGL